MTSNTDHDVTLGSIGRAPGSSRWYVMQFIRVTSGPARDRDKTWWDEAPERKRRATFGLGKI